MHSGAIQLPGATDAAVAYVENEADMCRAMIDVCEGVATPSPELVSELRCRAGRRGTATCRFRYADSRCRAHFVSAGAGADYRWALDWRSSPTAADPAWAVAWTHSPDPRRPRIRCRLGR